MKSETFMKIALNLARRGIGNTGSNPSVGCIIVKDGVILAQGRTAKNGRPHAEDIGLRAAGLKAKGATAYVTLEPCSHHGKTPPCAEKLIKSGIAEVVITCLDPDPRVNGRGIKILKKAGIKVTLGECEKEALEINKGFFKRIETGLPYVTLKAAISADGKFLEGSGKPNWVTGELARNYVHLLRSRNNVLITGTGTIIADNPQLNVRLNGLEDTSPKVLVMGKRKIKNFEQTQKTIHQTLTQLAKEGVNNVLLEAGSTLANAFIKEKMVDEIIIIQSTKKLGTKGKNYFAPHALANFKQVSEQFMGEDRILVYSRKL